MFFFCVCLEEEKKEGDKVKWRGKKNRGEKKGVAHRRIFNVVY